MKIRKLKKEDIRKFQVEEGEIGTRLDRAYQNSGSCSGCRSTITMKDILPNQNKNIEINNALDLKKA